MSPPPPQPSGHSPPVLVDDVIAEILLRLPPDEPACLVRASLVCKPWRLHLSDPAFLRRYRAFHRMPPVLGFLLNMYGASRARFVPTTSFRPPDPGLDLRSCDALDCRHGRALLYDYRSMDGLLVWDPMTGQKQHVREPDIPLSYFNAAVLCATAGCDHLDCHGGPFLVAFVGTSDDDGGAHACLYSSETGEWSEETYLQLDYYVETLPPVLVGNALYFICESGIVILRYDLGGDRGLSVIDRPDAYEDGIALMPAGDGGLGFAGLDMFTLHLWSLETGPDGVAGWARRRVIELEMLPIGDPSYAPPLIGFAKGCNSDIIFVSTDAGVFMIELESKRVRKVCETDSFYAIFPYMSFCTPECASGRLPSPATTQWSANESLNGSTQQIGKFAVLVLLLLPSCSRPNAFKFCFSWAVLSKNIVSHHDRSCFFLSDSL